MISTAFKDYASKEYLNADDAPAPTKTALEIKQEQALKRIKRLGLWTCGPEQKRNEYKGAAHGSAVLKEWMGQPKEATK